MMRHALAGLACALALLLACAGCHRGEQTDQDEHLDEPSLQQSPQLLRKTHVLKLMVWSFSRAAGSETTSNERDESEAVVSSGRVTVIALSDLRW